MISWIKKVSDFDKVKLSDSEEEYEGDENPSGNESVDGMTSAMMKIVTWM